MADFGKDTDNSPKYLETLGPTRFSHPHYLAELLSLLTTKSQLVWDGHIGEEGTRGHGHFYIYPPACLLTPEGKMPRPYWDVLWDYFRCMCPPNGHHRWMIFSDEVELALKFLRRLPVPDSSTPRQASGF